MVSKLVAEDSSHAEADGKQMSAKLFHSQTCVCYSRAELAEAEGTMSALIIKLDRPHYLCMSHDQGAAV